MLVNVSTRVIAYALNVRVSEVNIEVEKLIKFGAEIDAVKKKYSIKSKVRNEYIIGQEAAFAICEFIGGDAGVNRLKHLGDIGLIKAFDFAGRALFKISINNGLSSHEGFALSSIMRKPEIIEVVFSTVKRKYSKAEDVHSELMASKTCPISRHFGLEKTKLIVTTVLDILVQVGTVKNSGSRYKHRDPHHK